MRGGEAAGGGALSELLQRVAAGDRHALRMVYDAAAMKLLGIAVRILGDRQDAEDVVQDVFVSVWRKAAEFDPARASAEAWLYTMTRNRAIDRLRARGRRQMVGEAALETVADEEARADSLAHASDAARAVHHALAALPAEQAAVIRAAWLEGLTYEELSRRAGVPVGTVKTWVFRGL
ncbi:MAG: sigma-70 family RNA polymerase sigma factor, partial [Sphingomonadaceae bacterium]